MGKSTRFAIERNQTLPNRGTTPDAQIKGLVEPRDSRSGLEAGAHSTTGRAFPRPKPAKLGAEKLTPEEQRRRFIEAAREAGASEDEAEFDASLKRIAKAKGS